MRPRHKTAENTPCSTPSARPTRCFNEAAAQNRGKHDEWDEEDYMAGWLQ